jgi:hypothetical protein
MAINAAVKPSAVKKTAYRLLQRNFKTSLRPAACLVSDAEIKIASHIQQMQAAGFAWIRKDV